MEDAVERTEEGRPDDPLIGRILDGRYRVGSRVARGGMATVYQATDLRLDRTVAVKIMHAGLGDDPEFVARFEREARSAARLSHHNVVAVFDQGEDHGTVFLVMEYVPGLTLRDLIRKEAPMEPGKALGVLEPVLSALAAAHTAGMIHRDVKPENVLLADDGRIKVADFGLARAVNAETQHTATGGVLIGTVSYLSPELVVDGKADARSDVYAAGVLLYEMLTGHKPHQADSPIQVAYKHVHEDIPAPSLRVPGLPRYVDALVARATVRDKDLRPSDARVLLHQVRRVRQALDHGVVDDPELTEDLMPGPGNPDSAPTGELFVPREVPRGVAPPRPQDEVYDVERAFDPDLEMTAPVAPPMAPTSRTAATPPRPPVSPPPVVTGADRPRPAPRRSRRGPVLLISVLVLALLVGLGGWYLGVARYTHTPAVINMSSADAKAKVEKAGLSFKVGKSDYSETVAAGSVIKTDPDAGARISKDGTVTAVVSLGPERHAVPDVRGKSLDDAQAMLDQASLGFGQKVDRYSEKVAPNLVITTDPAPGTQLRPGTAVNVVVSRGPRPIEIPDWTGRNGEKAASALGDLGFTVNRTDQFSDTVAAGKVISQSPSSGSGFRGDGIALVVSKGPELVPVPAVRGAKLKDAEKTLEDAGFQVQVVHNPLYVGADYVVGSSPSEGELAPRGSTVTLSVV
ncbi:MAG: Stk1 family PASTA domain-containing Ser/Thr kinase [Propionibacteriales bacterium]|nr:Stk1 family PASTA domain-containing Ser/Thr kinase [Propionibacteriales bacterium]